MFFRVDTCHYDVFIVILVFFDVAWEVSVHFESISSRPFEGRVADRVIIGIFPNRQCGKSCMQTTSVGVIIASIIEGRC